MLSDLDPTERVRLSRAMRATLVLNAFHHRKNGAFDSIDPMSAMTLEGLGLIKRSEDESSPEELTALLTADEHERRLTDVPGPMLFFRQDKGSGSVVEVAGLLASPHPEVRLAAVRYFDALPEGCLAKRTRRAFAEARQPIASSKRVHWFPAAKNAFDILRQDLYLTFAGFNQCYQFGYDPGVQQYLTRLLRPDAILLGSVELEVWDPAEAQASACAAVEKVAGGDTFETSLSNYYRAFGHLPLTGPLGAGIVARAWMKRDPQAELWTRLWGWADQQDSPLPRYHVTSACLGLPEIVPPGLEATLWGEVAEIVRGDLEAPVETRWSEAWSIREEVAKHYNAHLSCLTPGFSSGRIVGMAWWLTERFCELLPDSPSILRHIRETTVKSEYERSRLINQLTRPPVIRSGLRYLTQFASGLWSTAILGEVGGACALFDKAWPVPSDRNRLEKAVVRVLVQAYPPPGEHPEQPIFGFDRPVQPVADILTAEAAPTEPDTRRAIAEFGKLSAAFSSEGALPQLIDALEKQDHDNHVRLAHAVRMLATTKPKMANELWELLGPTGRWKTVLAKCSEPALAHLFEALTELSVQDGEPWRHAVSQWFASSAEQEQSPERRHALFALTLFSCIHAGTVGAVSRLMHGNLRSAFIEFAAPWRKQLLAALPAAPPWAASRIRSVIPFLSADALPSGD